MSNTPAADAVSTGSRLNTLLRAAGLAPLDAAVTNRFAEYVSLLLRWNVRVNLTAVRDEEGILSRHMVESIACARSLPAGIHTLLDLGSGAGFPGVPIALCRPEIAVSLAESKGRKAAFLQEVIRVLGISAKVEAQRAESLSVQFDCVILRAVDRMTKAIETAAELVASGGWLVVMTTGSELHKVKTAAGPEFSWERLMQLPGSLQRLMAFGHR
jgi:16S rRNA (guanine527-N7)-methyltransferase